MNAFYREIPVSDEMDLNNGLNSSEGKENHFCVQLMESEFEVQMLRTVYRDHGYG